ncbi:class II fructose-bisphosphatase [Candidatus Woesearchaeota archaeon]|nr:class II fructose-bisphosphatase [Candidatus Woesearchaeota archaeon]
MDKNLALEFVRATEDAALSAARLVGKGDEKAADKAAVEAMRNRFSDISVNGTVVIGEGERDEAPMLYIGEKIGSSKGIEIDIAVDPLEGTTLTAKGDFNAMSVLAAAPKGHLLNAPDTYMDKIAVGREAKGVVDLDASVKENIQAVADKLDKKCEELTVIILERDRHKKLIEEVRACGARIRLIRDGDIAGALAPAIYDSGVDILMGIGGAPEGVIAAAALKALDGEIQGRLKPRNEQEIERAKKMGIKDIEKKLMIDDLVKGNKAVFAATGVTDGTILQGVRFTGNGAITHSLVMRAKTKTVRFIETHHVFN